METIQINNRIYEVSSTSLDDLINGRLDHIKVVQVYNDKEKSNPFNLTLTYIKSLRFKDGEEPTLDNVLPHLGERGYKFELLLRNVLKKGNIKEKYIDMLLEHKNIYEEVFTSSTVDPENNYEIYEQLGDISANKFLVWYMYKRFPQLKCTQGVKVVARLRINYGAKQSFYKIAEELGFWNFISGSNEIMTHKKKSVLEDVFEAFIGATEEIMNEKYCNGVGYAIIYDILNNIFDDIPISLKFEDLYDAKTRLKELSDLFSKDGSLGKITYIDEKKEQGDFTIAISTVYTEINGKKTKLGTGTSSLKADAQQKASELSIDMLKSRGFSKPIPALYKTFCK